MEVCARATRGRRPAAVTDWISSGLEGRSAGSTEYGSRNEGVPEVFRACSLMLRLEVGAATVYGADEDEDEDERWRQVLFVSEETLGSDVTGS